MSTISVPLRKTPWHLWAVAILTLLWNGSGAYTIMMAQAGRLSDVDANEAAYYAAQPFWFVVSTWPHEASTLRLRLSVSAKLNVPVATLRSTGARRLVN